MVDALRRAHRIVTPDGTVVELHPSASAAVIEVSDRAAGHVHTGDAPIRHAAAGAAVAAAVAEGLFVVERVVTFPFYSYADTIEHVLGIDRAYHAAQLKGQDEQEQIAAARAASQALSEHINTRLREPPLVE